MEEELMDGLNQPTDPPTNGDNTDGSTNVSKNNDPSKLEPINFLGGEPFFVKSVIAPVRQGLVQDMTDPYIQGWLYGGVSPQDYMARNQSNLIAIRNAAVNLIPNITGQVLDFVGSAYEVGKESIRQTFDLQDYLNPLDFENWFISAGEALSQTQWLPVKAKETAQSPQTFSQMMDPEFWAYNAPNVASTLSILIPSFGGLKLTKYLVQAAKAYKPIRSSIQALKKGHYALNRSAGLSQAESLKTTLFAVDRFNKTTDALTLTFFSRAIEGASLGKEAYEKTLAEGGTTEEASEAAATAYTYSWASATTDLVQSLGALGFLKFKNFGSGKWYRSLGNFALGVTTQAATEGIEEGYQYMLVEESARKALEGDEYQLEDMPLKEYLNSSEFMQSVTLGAAGGAFFQALTSAKNPFKYASVNKLMSKADTAEAISKTKENVNNLRNDPNVDFEDAEILDESLDANENAQSQAPRGTNRSRIGYLAGMKNWLVKQGRRIYDSVRTLGAKTGNPAAIEYQFYKEQNKLIDSRLSGASNLSEYEVRALKEQKKEIEKKIKNYESAEGFKPSDYEIDKTSPEWQEIKSNAREQLFSFVSGKISDYEKSDLEKGEKSEALLNQEKIDFKNKLKLAESGLAIQNIITDINEKLLTELEKGDDVDNNYINDLQDRKDQVSKKYIDNIQKDYDNVKMQDYESFAEYIKDLIQQPFIATLPRNIKDKIIANKKNTWNKLNNIKEDSKENKEKESKPIHKAKKGDIIRYKRNSFYEQWRVEDIDYENNKYILADLNNSTYETPVFIEVDFKDILSEKEFRQSFLNKGNTVNDLSLPDEQETPEQIRLKHKKQVDKILKQIGKLQKSLNSLKDEDSILAKRQEILKKENELDQLNLGLELDLLDSRLYDEAEVKKSPIEKDDSSSRNTEEEDSSVDSLDADDITDLETEIEDIETRRQQELLDEAKKEEITLNNGDLVAITSNISSTNYGKEWVTGTLNTYYSDITDSYFHTTKESKEINGEVVEASVEAKTVLPLNLYNEINVKYDAEYIDAVKKGTMTKEQAMKALEKAGRKDSDAYATLKGESKEEDPTVPDKFKPGNKVKLLSGKSKGQIGTIVEKVKGDNNLYKVKLEDGSVRRFSIKSLSKVEEILKDKSPLEELEQADIEKIRKKNDSLGKSILQKLNYKNENRLPNGNVKGGQSGWKIRFNIKNPKTGNSYYADGKNTLVDAEYNKRAETLINFLLGYFGSNQKADSKNLQKRYILEDKDGTKRQPFKHLSGGEVGESDFTIYIGSADDVMKFISDIRTKHPEILELLHIGNKSGDIIIDNIFKGRIEGAEIGFSHYHVPSNLNKVIGSNNFTFTFNQNKVNINYSGNSLSDITITVEGSSKGYGGVFDKRLKKDYPELYKNIRNIIGFQLYGDYLQGSNNEFLKLTGVNEINAKYDAGLSTLEGTSQKSVKEVSDYIKNRIKTLPNFSEFKSLYDSIYPSSSSESFENLLFDLVESQLNGINSLSEDELSSIDVASLIDDAVTEIYLNVLPDTPDNQNKLFELVDHFFNLLERGSIESLSTEEIESLNYLNKFFQDKNVFEGTAEGLDQILKDFESSTDSESPAFESPVNGQTIQLLNFRSTKNPKKPKEFALLEDASSDSLKGKFGVALNQMVETYKKEAGVNIDIDFLNKMWFYGNPLEFKVKFEVHKDLRWNTGQIQKITKDNINILVVVYSPSGKHPIGILKKDTFPDVREEMFNKFKNTGEEVRVVESDGFALINNIISSTYLDNIIRENTKEVRKPTSQVWGDNNTVPKIFVAVYPSKDELNSFDAVISPIPRNQEGFKLKITKDTIQKKINSTKLKPNETNFFIVTRDSSGRPFLARVHSIDVKDHLEVKEELDAIFEKIREVSEMANAEGVKSLEDLKKSENPTLQAWLNTAYKAYRNQMLELVRFKKETKKGSKVEPDFNANLIFVNEFQTNGVFDPKKYIESRKLYDKPTQINYKKIGQQGYIEKVIDRTETSLPSDYKMITTSISLGEYSSEKVARPPETETSVSSRSEPEILVEEDVSDEADFLKDDEYGDFGEFNKANEDVPIPSRFAGKKFSLNEQEAKETLKLLLGDFPLEIVDGLIKIGSFEAYAVAKQNLIQLSKFAPNKKVFHEAFHVVFQGILDNKTKSSLYEEAEQRYNITEGDISNATQYYSALVEKYGEKAIQSVYPLSTPDEIINLIALEEKMAEEYEEYGKVDTGVKGLLRKLFESIKRFIKKALGRWSEIDDVFRKINMGEYKTAHINKFNAEYYSSTGLTNLQKKELVNTLFYYNNVIYSEAINQQASVIDAYKVFLNKNPELDYFTRLDKGALVRIVKDLIANNYNADDLLKIVQSLRPDVKSIEVVETQVTKKVTNNQNEVVRQTTTIKTPKFNLEGSPRKGALYFDVIKELISRGFRVNNINLQVESLETTLDPQNAEDEILDEEKGEVKEYWSVNRAEISPKLSISNDLKRFLSTIPSGKKGFHGLSMTFDVHTLYPRLQSVIGGSTSIEDMMFKLQSDFLFGESIYKRIENWKDDPYSNKIVTQLWSIAQLRHSSNKVVLLRKKEENFGGETIEVFTPMFIEANRNSIVQVLQTEMERLYIENYVNSKTKKTFTVFDLPLPNITRDQLVKNKKLRESINISIRSDLKKRIKASNESGSKSAKGLFYKSASEIAEYYLTDWQSVSYSVEGKILYEWGIPGFINRFFHQIENNEIYKIQEFFKNDPLYEGISIFEYFEEVKPAIEKFDEHKMLQTLEGIKLENRTKGVAYKNFNDSEHWVALLASWMNNPSTDKNTVKQSGYGYLPMPVYSDAPLSEIYKIKKLPKDELDYSINWLINFETKRNSQTTLKGSVPSNYKKNMGRRFLIPEVMGSNAEEVMDWISRTIDGDPANGIPGLIDDVVNAISNVTGTPKENVNLYGKGRSYIAKELKSLMAHHIAYYGQLILVTGGDPAFYKLDADGKSVIDNFIKRIKQLHSPTTQLNPLAFFKDPTTEEISRVPQKNVIHIYKDVEVMSDDFSKISQIIKDKNQLDSYKSVSRTDGSSFISLFGLKARAIGLGEWSPAKNEIWKYLMQGKLPTSKEFRRLVMNLNLPSSVKKELLNFSSYETIKPFHYGLYLKELNESDPKSGVGRERIVPYQEKNSEAIMLPFEGLKIINGKPNPFFNSFYRKAMENEGFVFNDETGEVNYDQALENYNGTEEQESFAVTHSFDTVLKTYKESGSAEEAKMLKDLISSKYASELEELFNDETSDERIEEVYAQISSELPNNLEIKFNENQELEIAEKPGYYYTHEYNFEHWGKQQPNPNNYADKDSLMGSQYVKKIISDIYEIDNNAEILERYQKYIIDKITKKHDELLNRLENFEDLISILRDEVINRSKDDQLLEALKILDLEQKKTLLPLWHPYHSESLENILTSLFRKNITKVKYDYGYSLTNKSNYGYLKKPRIRFEDENGNLIDYDDNETKVHKIAYMEVILPMSISKKIKRYANEDGFIDDEAFAKMPDILKESIAYRVPTEDKNSMVKIKAIGFHPFSDNIILPDEFTIITGGDFDIDKMKGFYKMVKSTINDIIDKAEIREIAIEKKREMQSRVDELLQSAKNAQNPAQAKRAANKIIKKEVLAKVALDPRANEILTKENAKIQNENDFFDLMYHEILGHPSQSKALLRPGSYPDIDEAAEKYGTDKERYLLDLRTIVGMGQKMNVGASLIGISAVASSAKSLVQHFNLKIDTPFSFTKLKVNSLNEIANNLGSILNPKLVSSLERIDADFMKGDLGQINYPGSKVSLKAMFIARALDYLDNENKISKRLVISELTSDIVSVNKTLVEEKNTFIKELNKGTIPQGELRTSVNSYLDSILNYLIVVTAGDKNITNLKEINSPDFIFNNEFLASLDSYLESKHLDDISSQISEDGKTSTTQNVNQHVTAFVDHGNDPKAEKINVNTYTADFQMALVALGFSIQRTAAILNHPVFKDLTKKAIDEKAKIIDYLNTTEYEDSADSPNMLIFDENNNILNSDLEVAEYLGFIALRVSEISDMIRYSREPDKGAGPDIATTYIKHLLFLKYKKFKHIFGAESMFENEELFYMRHLYKKGILSPLQFLTKNLKFPNILGPNFYIIVDTLEKIKNSPLNKDEIKELYRSYINYAGYGFYDMEGFKFGKSGLDVNSLKKKYPNNRFVKRLSRSDKGYLIFLGNTGNDPDENRIIREGFSELPEDIREYLKKYAFFSIGLNRVKKQGFAHLLPINSFLNDGLTEHLDKHLSPMFEDENSPHTERFLSQYIRNFFSKLYFITNVPYNDIKGVSNFKNLSKNPKEIKLISSSELEYKGRYIKTSYRKTNVLLKWHNKSRLYYSIPSLGVTEGRTTRVIEYDFESNTPETKFKGLKTVVSAYDYIEEISEAYKGTGIVPTTNNPSEHLDLINLNEEQSEALSKIKSFLKVIESEPQWFVLSGEAGTGKSTVASKLIKELQATNNIVVSAFTAEAVNKLKEKVIEATGSQSSTVVFRTIHSMLGRDFNTETKDFNAYDEKKETVADKADIIIVDEASTVSETLFNDIMRLKAKKPNVKLIFLGDIGQHNPVRTASDYITMLEKQNKDGSLNEIIEEIKRDRFDKSFDIGFYLDEFEESSSPVFDEKNNFTELTQRVRQGEASSIHEISKIYRDNVFAKTPSPNPLPKSKRVNTNNVTFTDSVDNLPKAVIDLFKDVVTKLDRNIIKVVTYRNDTRKEFNEFVRDHVFGANAKAFEKGDVITFNRSYYRTSNQGAILINRNENFQLKNTPTNISKVTVGELLSKYGLPVPTKESLANIEIEFVDFVVEQSGREIGLTVVSPKYADNFNQLLKYLRQQSKKLGLPTSVSASYKNLYSSYSNLPNVDYAYAITSHKAEGSTYNQVIVLEDDFIESSLSATEKSRGLYVAITRASEHAYIISRKNSGIPAPPQNKTDETTGIEYIEDRSIMDEDKRKILSHINKKGEIVINPSVSLRQYFSLFEGHISGRSEVGKKITQFRKQVMINLEKNGLKPSALKEYIVNNNIANMFSLLVEQSKIDNNFQEQAHTLFNNLITDGVLNKDLVNLETSAILKAYSQLVELLESPTIESEMVKGGFDQKNIFTVNPIQSTDKKAKSKAKIATQYIGFAEGITGSSTALYAKQAGQYANTGNYTSNDVIFVSVPGRRGDKTIRKQQQDKTIKEAIKALEAGATLITDNAAYVESSSYNEGEKRLAANLKAKGYNYSEITVDNNLLGVWNKTNVSPTSKDTEIDPKTDLKRVSKELPFNYGVNKNLVLSGDKTISSRNFKYIPNLEVGESGLQIIDGVPFKVTYHGELKHSEVKSKTGIDYSEGEAFNKTPKGGPTEKKTEDFIKGIGKKHIYQLERIDQQPQPSKQEQVFPNRKVTYKINQYNITLKDGSLYFANGNLVSDETIENKFAVKEALDSADRVVRFSYNNSKYAAIINYKGEFKIISLAKTAAGKERFKQGTREYDKIIKDNPEIVEMYKKYCS